MFEPSLVQYENPELITKTSTKVALDEKREMSNKMILMSIDELLTQSGADVMDMLDVLLPPRISKFYFLLWLL